MVHPGVGRTSRERKQIMTFDWMASGPAGVIDAENHLVANFGDAGAELAAAAAGSVVVAPLVQLGLISCQGEDARGFLHNQLTSDVNHLNHGQAQHAAWCSAKGRMLASFVVMRTEAGYLLRLSADLVPAIAKRLQMFVLRAKVKVSDVSPTHVNFGVAGNSAASALESAGMPVPAAVMTCAEFQSGRVLRLDESRFEIIVNSDAASRVWGALAALARPVGTPVWQWIDIARGLPVISSATQEEFVPQMTNFDKLGGVSFHKGCYPGQEIIARTQYLGKVKRHLYRVSAASTLAAGQPLFSTVEPDHACGMVVSAAPAPDGGFVALAVIQEGAAAADVHVAAFDGHRLTAVEPVAA